ANVRMSRARSKTRRPFAKRWTRKAPRSPSSVLPPAIPSDVQTDPAVVTFTRNAPRNSAGQTRYPSRSAAARAMPVGGHTGDALVAPAARGGAARRAVLALEVAHDLPRVLLCEEALLLHLLEDLPPALAALLHVHDLVGRQPRRAGLRLEQGTGDLLLDGRELGERLRPAGLRPCADRHQDEGENRPDHDPPHRSSPLI